MAKNIPLSTTSPLVADTAMDGTETQSKKALLQTGASHSAAELERLPSETAQLHQNRDTLFNFIENAPFGVYVVDAQFRMCQASAVSLNVFSSVHPLIGRDFEEIVRTVWTDSFASEVLARFRHTLETGEPYVAPSTVELRKDIPGVESYDWKIHRITLPGGQFGVVCYFHDITERKLAEDALRESEAFGRSIIKSSPDCIKVLDLEGNLLSMESGQALLGIEDIQPFLNKSWIEFWHGEHRQAARASVALARTAATGTFVGFFRTLRGEPKWWDVSISPILDAQGRPARLLAVSRDVTERRQAEMNFEFLSAVSLDLVHLSDVGELMQTVGAKIAGYLQLSLCAFVEVDEAAEQVVIHHDWPREEVPSLAGVYRLADFVEPEFIQAARAGEVIVVRNVAEDTRTDSAKFAALKIASFICVPLIRDAQWRFGLCLYHSMAYDWRADEIELARELTARIWTRLERLRAEAALRESEERYRNLFNSMDQGFCIIEVIFDAQQKAVDWRFLEVNPSFEKQSGVPDITGKRIRELAPDHEEYWFEIYGKVALTGDPVRFVNQAKAMEGRWFDLYAFRIGGEQSRRVAVLFTDITQRKQSESNLNNAMAIAEKANRAKSDFLSSMSHELRTPLNAILGFAQLMQSGSPPPTAPQNRSLDHILKGGWYLLELINEILDLAMIESGKAILSRESVSLGEVMRECRALIEAQAEKRDIVLTFPSFKTPTFVHADRKRVKQVLLNFLSNAIKYNKQGGAVGVEYTMKPPNFLRISVRDTGEGLAADQLAQLFQPFNRLGKGGSSEEGTGIGLAVSKQLVELMGGVIGAESTVGLGSVFWMELSLTTAPQATLGADQVMRAPPPLRAWGSPRTVLYLEDNPANLEMIEQLIARRPDLHLLSAVDVDLGIEFARDHLPDVILMDISLPGNGGFHALKRLRGDPATAHIPVLAISAYAMTHNIQSGMEAGFFHYLTKPIKVNEFMEALDRALALAASALGNETGSFAPIQGQVVKGDVGQADSL